MTTAEPMKNAFDNAEFTAWLVEFEKALIECGMPERQAMRYRNEYHTDAVKHFMFGDSPDEAAVKQLL
jgi:hypothetical protein